ncbi:MAG: hypothetical protein NTV21_17530 [Planctomycetota bacterium]|nr:hypothetical protein [Planctomycetota bacterium]
MSGARNPVVWLGIVMVLGGIVATVAAYVLLAEPRRGSAPEFAVSTAATRPNTAEQKRDFRSEVIPADSRELAADSAATRSDAPVPPPAREPDGIEDGGVAPQPALDFRWKYAASTHEELLRARGDLETALDQQVESLCGEYFARGEFEKVPLGSRARDAVVRVLLPRGQLGTARDAAAVPDSNGKPVPSNAIEVVRLGKANHPELYELYDEFHWLEQELERQR